MVKKIAKFFTLLHDIFKLILKIWIGLSVFEEAYLYSEPEIAGLLFIGGQWRKFSIFTNPVDFSYHMVASALLCIGLLTGPFFQKN